MRKINKKNLKKREKTKAFTIIEVLIVLAIAALILLTVFLAARTLGVITRDHYRRNYAQKLLAAEFDFYSYYGVYPACDSLDPNSQCTPQDAARATTFLQSFLPNGVDPFTGQAYSQDTLVTNLGSDVRTSTNSVIYYYNSGVIWNHNFTPAVDQILIENGHWCYRSNPDGNNTIIAGSGPHNKNLAIVIGTERNTYYCIDNY